MKTISEYNKLPVPTYALSYLVNGDASGINETDIATIDKWYSQFTDEAKQCGGHVIFSVDGEDEFFTWNPEFGLASSCLDCMVLICTN